MVVAGSAGSRSGVWLHNQLGERDEAFDDDCRLLLGAAVAGTSALAADRASTKEAEAMVKKGVAYVKAHPREKAMADISNKKGEFVDRDLYLTVYTMDKPA